MKQIIFIPIIALAMFAAFGIGSAIEHKARRGVEAQLPSYTVTDFNWQLLAFSCGEGDWQYDFKAVNNQGATISGSACAGLLRGTSVRTH